MDIKQTAMRWLQNIQNLNFLKKFLGDLRSRNSFGGFYLCKLTLVPHIVVYLTVVIMYLPNVFLKDLFTGEAMKQY